ncbi:hypothetical protein GF345_00190 [Candidatus Woesearchaeota archaeon]|nr:hypothetical protein [Candidatus Woesearchaeota archaeon]
MAKMKKERLYTYLLAIGAIASFMAGSYIVIDIYLTTKQIDFTWASNILLGLSGGFVLAMGYFHNLAKEKEADLFSD